MQVLQRLSVHGPYDEPLDILPRNDRPDMLLMREGGGQRAALCVRIRRFKLRFPQ